MNIVIFGSGNVAWHLGHALKDKHKIVQVISRNKHTAYQLSEELNCSFSTNIEDISTEGDVVLLCLQDDQIYNLAESLKIRGKIVAHTSGATPGEVLGNTSEQYGVFYPFQTLTKGESADLSEVPLLVEGCDEPTEKRLLELAKSISNRPILSDTETRLRLHIAGVFASNFINHMLFQAKQQLDKKHLDFSLIEPLLTESVRKAIEIGPSRAQTGPARRKDEKTLNKHFELLPAGSMESQLYKLISESIAKTYHQEG